MIWLATAVLLIAAVVGVVSVGAIAVASRSEANAGYNSAANQSIGLGILGLLAAMGLVALTDNFLL